MRLSLFVLACLILCAVDSSPAVSVSSDASGEAEKKGKGKEAEVSLENAAVEEVVNALEHAEGLGFKVRESLVREGRIVRLKPVFLVPTVMGNGLSAMAKRAGRGGVCRGRIPRGRFAQVWLRRFPSQRSRLRVADPCAVSALGLNIDEDGLASNRKDLVYRPVEGVAPLENTSSPPFLTEDYMKTLVGNLRGLGLVDGENLFAGSYDWRRTPDNQRAFFSQWMKDINRAARLNRRLPVTVLAHGAGNLYFLYFLRLVEKGIFDPANYEGLTPEAWIAARIDTYYAVAAPFLGTPAAIRDAVFGTDRFRDLGLTRSRMRRLLASLESTAYQFPVDLAYEKFYPSGQNDVIKVGHSAGLRKGRSFDQDQLEEAFRLIDGARMVKDDVALANRNFARLAKRIASKEDLKVGLHPPKSVANMHVRCFWSEERPTPFKLHLAGIDQINLLTMTTVKGDGVVPLRSASFCTQWSSKGNVIGKATEGDHRTILSSQRLNLSILRHIIIDIAPPVPLPGRGESEDNGSGSGSGSASASGDAGDAAQESTDENATEGEILEKRAREEEAQHQKEQSNPDEYAAAVARDDAFIASLHAKEAEIISKEKGNAEALKAGVAKVKEEAHEAEKSVEEKANAKRQEETDKEAAALASGSGAAESSSSSSQASQASSSQASSSSSSSATSAGGEAGAQAALSTSSTTTKDDDEGTDMADAAKRKNLTPAEIIARANAQIAKDEARLKQLDGETASLPDDSADSD